MDLIEKINKLTTIQLSTLKDLQKRIHLIHSNEVATQIREDKIILELDTFEGTVYISLEDDNIRYKFIPSKIFNNTIIETLKSKESLLAKEAEKKLKEILIKTYKDIL